MYPGMAKSARDEALRNRDWFQTWQRLSARTPIVSEGLDALSD